MAYPTDLGVTYNQVTPSQKTNTGDLPHSGLHNALATEVQALKEKVGINTTGTLDVLASDLNTLEGSVSTLGDDLTTLEGEVSAIETAGMTSWQPAGETWTYASATTFTVSGDLTNKYIAGTGIKLTQTTVKQFRVASSSFGGGNTTVTVYGGATTLANATITDPYYSRAYIPEGFPISLNNPINLKSISTSSVVAGTYIQYGWGFIEGNGTGLVTQAVTFPTTFATAIYTLGATHLGNKNSTPTAITDLTSAPAAGVAFTAIPSSPTTSGFTINLSRSTGNYASGNYYGYSWWALGK